MTDRRADDDTQPLAPRRTLSAPAAATAVAGSAAGSSPVPPAVQARTQDVPARPAARTDAAGSGSSPAPARPETAPTPAARTPPAPRPGVRKARLRVSRVDPWSVMKMAFALSIAVAVVTVVAVVVVWLVLDAAGVWDAINSSVSTVLESDSGFDVTNYVGLGRVVGVTMVLAAVDVVLITALATLGAFLYNLAAALLGGLEVTLAEDR